MRVISGSARGTKLFSPPTTATRPTSDFVKENLFNIIQGDLRERDICFLDLFAGTGAIGIEALSRGASYAVFLESNQTNIDILRKNLQKTRLEKKADIIKGDIFTYIKRLHGSIFDIIFMDPPYFEDYYKKTFDLILKYELLAKDGMIISEMSRFSDKTAFSGFKEFKVKEYSATRLVFYEHTKHVRLKGETLHDCGLSGKL